ncbi:MAG TPA: hypothetical protein VEG36_04235 [Burkholderiales bacterium]|nr:hypothetical protein [Burkholderiales bacterium]
MTKLATAVLVVALLAGCVSTYALVEPKRQTVGGAISVEPSLKWNKLGSSNAKGRIEIWTLDGPELNTLVFFTGVPDGEPLFERASADASRAEKPPVFRSSMNPLEIQELLEATVRRFFQTTLAEERNLRPQPVAEGRGFRFDTSMTGQDGVERSGVFAGAIRGGKLYGAWFQGAKLHYFERYLPEFDHIVASARLLGAAAAQ